MKILQKYYAQHHSKIAQLLSLKPRKYTPENFHKLRVDLKKLNALFEIINYCSRDFKRKKSFKPYKKLFKQAGAVRELQLEENLLKLHDTRNTLKKFREKLSQRREVEQEIFFELLRTLSITEGNKIIPLLAAIEEKTTQEYLRKKEDKIASLLKKKTIDETQLHELRKRLKQLNYNLGSLNEKKEKKKITNLTDLLGQWHDCQVMAQYFEKAIKNNEVEAKELPTLKRIIKKLTTEEKQYLLKINKVLSSHSFSLK